VFLIGFAHAMTIAFRGSQNEHFDTPVNSFTTLFFFIFNLDTSYIADDVSCVDNHQNLIKPTHNNNNQDTYRGTIALILLAMYETLVVVVFLNLVIAVMTTSFDDVMSNAKTEWLLVRAFYCYC
jgi:hypothetical protein